MDDPERIELYLDGLHMYESEPELTNDLRSCGFVVERDVQDYADGGTVLLQTTPSAGDISATVSWYRDGPTADLNDVRIVWEADRLEQVRADAEHPTVYVEPDVPAETERTVIDEGEGWVAVVPSDRVDHEHGRASWQRRASQPRDPRARRASVADADEYDLVEVDVDADPDGDRRPRSPGG